MIFFKKNFFSIFKIFIFFFFGNEGLHHIVFSHIYPPAPPIKPTKALKTKHLQCKTKIIQNHKVSYFNSWNKTQQTAKQIQISDKNLQHLKPPK